jgi:hypothetical protein
MFLNWWFQDKGLTSTASQGGPSRFALSAKTGAENNKMTPAGGADVPFFGMSAISPTFGIRSGAPYAAATWESNVAASQRSSSPWVGRRPMHTQDERQHNQVGTPPGFFQRGVKGLENTRKRPLTSYA